MLLNQVSEGKLLFCVFQRMETLVYLRIGVMLVLFSTLFISFIISGLIINAIQLALWLTVKQVSPWLYRKVNYYLLTLLWNRKYALNLTIQIVN